MKSLIWASIAVLLGSVAAQAEPKNNTPASLACMKKAGITYAGWRSGHAGTQAQVDRYIACRDEAAR